MHYNYLDNKKGIVMAKLTDNAKKLFENLTIFYHLKQMPQSQRDTFFGLQKKDLLSNELEKWKVYMEAIQKNTIPDDLKFTNLATDDQKSAYNHLQDWFTQLSEDDELMTDSKVNSFVTTYKKNVGNTRYRAIANDMAKEIASAINANINDFEYVMGIEKKELEELAKALNDTSNKPYTTDTDTHKIFEKFLDKLYDLSFDDSNDSNAGKLIRKLPAKLQENELNQKQLNKLRDDIGNGNPIANDKKEEIKTAIGKHKADLASITGISEADLTDLEAALDSTNYLKDPAKGTFLQLLTEIEYYGYSVMKDYLPKCLKRNTVKRSKIEKLLETVGTRVTALPTNPAKLNDFDEKLRQMFDALEKDKKLRDKVKPKAGEIETQIDKGIANSNYDEGKTKLDHKLNYKKNFFKRGTEKLKEHMTETVGKLAKRHNRHNYQDVCAKETVGALIGKGAKPSDGTEKLLENLKAVQKSVSQKSQSKLDWGIKELDKLSKAGYFKGALRKGRDMRQMVEQIVLDAAHDGKKEEAKTLLETLAVMRYSPVSSSVRDDLRAAEFKIFSGTSLAKENDFMGNFMGALDATIRWAGLGMFEIANFTKNMINSAGARVYKRRLNESTKDSEEFKDVAKHSDMTELFNFWNLVNGVKSHSYNILRRKSKSTAPDFNAYNSRHAGRFS